MSILAYLEGIRDTLNQLRLTAIEKDAGPHIDGIKTAIDVTDAGPHIDDVEAAITATDAGPHIDDVEAAITATDPGPHIDDLSGDVAAGLNAVAAAIDRIAVAEETQLITPLPDPHNPPTPGEPPDPATDPAPDTHPDWDSYLCGAGAVLCDVIAQLADDIRGFHGTPLWGVLAIVGVIAALLGGAFTGGFSLVVAVGLVIDLWAALGATGESVIDAYLENIADEMRNNTTLRGCVSAAMRDGDGVDSKVANVKTAIENNMTGNGGNIAKLMVFPEAVEMLAYGRDDGAGGIEYASTPVGAYCNCIPPGYVLESFGPGGNDPTYSSRFSPSNMVGRYAWTGNPRSSAGNAYRWFDYTSVGNGDPLLVQSISFDYCMHPDFEPQTAGYTIRYADGSEVEVSLPFVTEWTNVLVNLENKPVRSAGGAGWGDAFFGFWVFHNGEDTDLIECGISHVDMVHNAL